MIYYDIRRRTGISHTHGKSGIADAIPLVDVTSWCWPRWPARS
jgi:hypothetical protein